MRRCCRGDDCTADAQQAGNQLTLIVGSPSAPRTILKTLFSLIAILLSGCAEARCDKEIDSATAVKIAREYFLARSLALLKFGESHEQKEAKRMEQAGMTEEIYRETFLLAIPGRPRRVGSQFCGHPYIYFDVRRDLNADGFQVVFVRVVAHSDQKRWAKTATSLYVTKCGRAIGFGGTYATEFFPSGETNYAQFLIDTGFQACP